MTFQAWKSQHFNSRTFQGLYEPCLTYYSERLYDAPFLPHYQFCKAATAFFPEKPSSCNIPLCLSNRVTFVSFCTFAGHYHGLQGTETEGQRPLFQDNLGKLATERQNHSGLYRSKRRCGGSSISWTICKSFVPHSRQITTTPHTHTIVLLFFWNLSGTTQVSRYQKGKNQGGKTNLDLLEQEIVSGSGICWAISAPHPRQPRQHPTTQFFHRSDALPATQPTASKH